MWFRKDNTHEELFNNAVFTDSSVEYTPAQVKKADTEKDCMLTLQSPYVNFVFGSIGTYVRKEEIDETTIVGKIKSFFNTEYTVKKFIPTPAVIRKDGDGGMLYGIYNGKKKIATLTNFKYKYEKYHTEKALIPHPNGITKVANKDVLKPGDYFYWDGEMHYVAGSQEGVRWALKGNLIKPNNVITSYVESFENFSGKSGGGCFLNDRSFNEDISSWDTSNVVTMREMFYMMENFNQDISNWDTSKVTDMTGMFYWAESFNQPIGNWNVNQVTTMREMFEMAKSFNQPIGRWNVWRVADMRRMFDNARSFNQNLNSWGWKLNVWFAQKRDMFSLNTKCKIPYWCVDEYWKEYRRVYGKDPW